VPSSRFHLPLRVLSILLSMAMLAASAVAAPFTPQTRVGYTVGDQWEPALAADGFGHVYVLYPQYGRVPGCPLCPEPSMTLVVSSNNGETWESPRQITPARSGQFDPQIVVDPIDHRTLYAAWLQSGRSEVIVAKSADFGQSWLVISAARMDDIDKPTLAVRGADVYVAFNHERNLWIAASHDGGISYVANPVTAQARGSWSLPGGGTVDPSGTVHFAWAQYSKNRGRVNLYISRSSDGGKSWSNTFMGASGSAPDCSMFRCEDGYLGAQINVTSDAAGTLYALWNASTRDKRAPRIFFASSTTGGVTWSQKAEVSKAPANVNHAFPALVAGFSGDVRIAWMDTRNSPHWNTYYRSSTNGGASWSSEARISGDVPGYIYIRPEGFGFPFGDYFELGIDSRGQTQAVWGEGLNFKSPGSIWHSIGR